MIRRLMNPPARSALALAAGLAVLLGAGAAGAYCRTSTCGDTKYPSTVCTPPQDVSCAENRIPLFWSKPCVEFSVQQGASTKVTFDQTEATLKAAFDT